ncbi:class I SAM-dependent methyltransferase [Fibrella aquatica]|uniref:class I SAM-dependent methyltransferase n=1 Tax=Fibrella aquatica TaxID=3242487 RepID=UPI00352215FA
MTFDAVAPFYDSLARLFFGRSLIRAQQWGIGQVRSGSRVLMLGGGTGVTLPDLLSRQPSSVLFVEASGSMLTKARQRTQPDDPVSFQKGTEADLPETIQFDAILLPFVLDLYPFHTLQGQMLPTLLDHLAPGGQLIVTDFARPQTYWQQAYMWLMLRFFGLLANIPARQWTDWPMALRQAGLMEATGCSFRANQVRSGCWVR